MAADQPIRSPIDWIDLAGKQPPERRWAIKGWLGFGHTTLMVGQGGIGKTLLAQQMASCLALGRSFISEVTEPLKCLMWACEDDHDELWRRQLAISRWSQVGLEEYAQNLVIVPRHGMENALVTTEFGKMHYTPLIGHLEEQAKDLKADVVILDNVAQLYGASENDRHAVTAFLNALSGALDGLALLLLAHPSRSSGSEYSGSGAWENVARTRLYLGSTLPGEKQTEEEPSDDARYLSRRKANYSSKDWRRMTFVDGTLRPEEASDSQGGIVAEIRAKNAEKTIRAGVAKLLEMGIASTDGATSPRYLPRLLHEYKLTGSYTRPELAEAMRRLMLCGSLKRGQVGKHDNRAPIYGLQWSE